jgi:6,7-dimethyl-8-ribityllumazine synthase
MSLDAPTHLSIDGSPFTVGVVAARYNARLVEALLSQVTGRLRAAGVKEKRLFVERVPGSNELPSAGQLLLRRRKCDVVVALGVIVRGGTLHYELVAQAATDGLLRVSLDAGVPVITGVVVAENLAQAEERCLGKIDRGAEFAQAALEMAALRKRLSS